MVGSPSGGLHATVAVRSESASDRLRFVTSRIARADVCSPATRDRVNFRRLYSWDPQFPSGPCASRALSMHRTPRDNYRHDLEHRVCQGTGYPDT